MARKLNFKGYRFFGKVKGKLRETAEDGITALIFWEEGNKKGRSFFSRT